MFSQKEVIFFLYLTETMANVLNQNDSTTSF